MPPAQQLLRIRSRALCATCRTGHEEHQRPQEAFLRAGWSWFCSQALWQRFILLEISLSHAHLLHLCCEIVQANTQGSDIGKFIQAGIPVKMDADQVGVLPAL